MFCNIENTFLGNKLNKTFSEVNRNKLANLVEMQDFKEWFGDGRKDIDGNPVLDDTLSFTNGNKEKKNIFDFADITIQSRAEVAQILKSSTAISSYRGDLYINNTSKDAVGNYKASSALRLVNAINYYYPGLLTVELRKRNGESIFSKDKSIPLPVIKINEVALVNPGALFSVNETQVLDRSKGAFQQIPSVEDLIASKDIVDEFRSYGIEQKEIAALAKHPSVSNETYAGLLSFVKKINPDFKVEEISNLSENGIAYINDFLIQVNTEQRFSAMPEEVAHFFFELLPENHELKRDMIKNITSFPIYSLTLNQYKNEYTKDGKTDFEKIKREASAKLISEYIYANSTGDSSRVEKLTRVKSNFITKWWNNLINAIKRAIGLRTQDMVKAYITSADAILSEKVEWLSLDETLKNGNDGIFFQKPDSAKVRAELANAMINQVIQAGKLGELQEVITKFSRDINVSFNKIVGNKVYDELNKELSKDGTQITDINYMSQLNDVIKNIDVTADSTSSMLASRNQVINFAEFIGVLADMRRLAEAIDIIANKYNNTDRFLENVVELQAFRDLYQNFIDFTKNDFIGGILSGSEVETEFIDQMNQSISIFDALDKKIINKLRTNYKAWFKSMIAPQNRAIINTLVSDLERSFFRTVSDKDSRDRISLLLNNYVQDLENGKTKSESRKKLIDSLSTTLSAKDLEGEVLKNIFTEVEKLYTTDDSVNDFLNGLGKDIDPTSHMSHWVTAGIKNHDIIVANIAKFIVDKRSSAENMASIAIRDFQSKVSPILNNLQSKFNIDEYKAGESITFIDDTYDPTTEEGTRKIVRFLSPTTGSAEVDRRRLEKEKKALREALIKETAGTPEHAEAKKVYTAKRREYLNFIDNYFNSPFVKELQDFYKKWNNDDMFLDIKEEWDKISEEIRMFEQNHESDKMDQQAYSTVRDLRRKRSELLKEGNKTGDDLKKTQLLKQWLDEGSKFRTEDTRRTERNFNLAKNNHLVKVDFAINEFLNQYEKDIENRTLDNLDKVLQSKLGDATLSIKLEYQYLTTGVDGVSEEIIRGDVEVAIIQNILMGRWEKRNTIKVKNNKYYEDLDEVFKTIEALKEEKGLTRIDIRISELYKEINELLTDRKDAYGERNPNMLDQDELDRLDQIEIEIGLLKSYNPSRAYRITDASKTKFVKYAPDIDEYEEKITRLEDMILDPSANIPAGKTSQEIEDDLNNLRKDIYETSKAFELLRVVTDEQKQLTKDIANMYSALSSLTQKVPTQEYWERMEHLVENFDEMLRIALRERDDAVATGKSPAQILSANEEVDNLKGILYGKNDDEGGLINALYDNNYDLVDRIINDEYFVSIGGKNKIVEFRKYFEDDDPNIGIPPMEDMDSETYQWFMNAHTPGTVFKPEYDPITETYSQIKNVPIDRAYTRKMLYTATQPSPKLADEYLETKKARRYRATKIEGDSKEGTGYFKKQISWDTINPSTGEKYDMEDWTVDNNTVRPNLLPLSRKQLAENNNPNTKYLNKEYYKLKDSNTEQDNLLKQYHSQSLDTYLEEQSTKPDQLKAYLNIPVSRLDEFSELKATFTNLPDRIKRKGQAIKGFFTKSEATDAEDQLAGIDQIRDIDEDTQRVITNKVPKLGSNTKLPVERVNRNVLAAMTDYIHRSKDFDSRSDMDPIVKGLLDVFKANEDVGHRSQKKRVEIFNKIYQQMILQEMPDNITNSRAFRKMSGAMMGMSAMRLMFDALGGGINYLQANINNMIESFAGQHVTMKNYSVGYARATEMVGQMVSDFSKKDDYAYWTLMYQSFDFIQGEWLEDLQERASSKDKKFNWQKISMYPRKNGELHAQSAMAIAMLDREKIKNDIDGKMYPMWDIYKKQGNQLVLKDGFDNDKYNPVNGTEYQRIKGKIWSVNMDLHGNYAKLTQTEASRHSIGKMAENMKRWFVSGFQRRFGRESFDVNKTDIEQGYYSTTALFIFNTLKNAITMNEPGLRGQLNYYWNTPRRRANLRRTATEIGAATLLWLITSYVFGYDDDDPDKNKKLQKASWAYNEGLLLFLRAFAEQTAYIPVPPLGFTEMSRNLLDPFSVAKSSFTNAIGSATLGVYTAGYYLGIDQLQDDAKYMKGTGAGKGNDLYDPFNPMLSVPGEKGDLKLMNYLAKTIGYTGSQVDPSFYIKNYEAMQNRLK